MNIKRIGLIGGSGVVGGGTTPGGSGSEDNIWKLEIGSKVSVERDQVDVVLGPAVHIGVADAGLGRGVYIADNVYIGTDFDSRYISTNDLWTETSLGIQSITDNRSIKLGKYIDIGINTNKVVINHNGIDIIGSTGSRTYIKSGFSTTSYFDDTKHKILPTVIPFESLSNGNIKLGEREFMPATPSGDPLHYAYETAGAEYNHTTDFIVKDSPWNDMVDTIEDKAKWGFDVVDASQVKQMTIGGTTYNYVQTTRQSPEGTTEPRYFLVGQASDGTWVEDETKVLHLPGHWYLNGLGDITNKEMRRILDEKEVKYRWDKTRGGQATRARTVIPVNTISNIDMIPKLVTPYGIRAESICITGISQFKALERANALSVANTGASNRTRYIQTCKDASGTPFDIARVVSFIELTQNCNISNVPLLSKPSILYTINTATPTTPITITLHANRYAQLAEDTNIVAALEAKNAALEGTGGSISLVSA